MKKKRKIRRKRIKFNEKRQRLNYYDRLFRYNHESESKVLPNTNFSSDLIKIENEVSENKFYISKFEKKVEEDEKNVEEQKNATTIKKPKKIFKRIRFIKNKINIGN